MVSIWDPRNFHILLGPQVVAQLQVVAPRGCIPDAWNLSSEDLNIGVLRNWLLFLF